MGRAMQGTERRAPRRDETQDKPVARTRRASGKAGDRPARARSERAPSLESDLNLYFKHINRFALLTADEEKELGWRVVNDNDTDARQQLVNANLRLVVAIGRHYIHRGLTLADVIAEGNLGLIRAVDGFDPARGARFSTYASWWIKQAIKRSLLNARQPIHIPAYMIELIARWKTSERHLSVELGRKPTTAELARHLALSRSQLDYLLRAVRAHEGRPRELSEERGDGAGSDVAPTKTTLPDQPIAQSEEMIKVDRLLNAMDERCARVFRLRFGLEGREAMTLKEVGREVGLTRERVRQIEAQVLARLRRQVAER